MNYAVIVAAGKSKRMGENVDKAFVTLGSKPVLAYSLMAFERCPDIDGIIVVVRKERLEAACGLAKMFGGAKVRKVVAGGAQRQSSVLNGLAELNEDVAIVAVHDGARPCVSPALISATILSAKRHGSGVAAVKVTDTIKQVDAGLTVAKTIDRSKLWAVQTPQSFKVDVLRKALEAADRGGLTITDESSAVEAAGGKVHLVESSVTNMKITTPDDLMMVAALLKV